MKAAVPTADKKEIFTRTGQAPGFLIVDVNAGSYNEQEYKLNHKHEYKLNHKHEKKHDETKEHKHEEIQKLLKGTSYIIVNAIGKHLKKDMDEIGVKIYRSKEKNVDKAIEDFRKNVLS